MISLRAKLQPRQKAAYRTLGQHPVVLYGGAKGGGKSYLTRAWLLSRRAQYPGTHGLLIRKTYPELFHNHIQKLFQEWPELAGYFNKGEKILYLPNGSTLTFGHLQYPENVYQYQGLEYEDIAVDEITQHDELTYQILRTTNRTTHPTIRPRMLLTGNPGGVGHFWVKRLFLDRDFLQNENPPDYAFVPAKVYDNAFLATNDQYLSVLRSLPEEQRKAYLEGDWDIFAGQYFSEWRREVHVALPFPIPTTWKKYRMIDFGRTAPFACYWAAVDYDGGIWVYREYYAAKEDARPNTQAVIALSADDPVNPETGNVYELNPIGKDVFAKAGQDQTIAELMERTVVTLNGKIHTLGPLHPAGGDRPINRVAGWALFHEYLRYDEHKLPKLHFFPTCVNAIRTIPSLVYDAKHPEDLDTTGEDHAADAVRHLLISLHEQASPKPKNEVEKRIERLKRATSPQFNPRQFYAT